MEVKIEVTKVETIEINEEVVKEACRQEVLRQFEYEFERYYNEYNSCFMDIQICLDTDDIISNR